MGNPPTITVCHASRLPVAIADMPPWGFWSRHDALGLNDVISAALLDGTATEAQQAEARRAGEAAKMTLLSASGVYPERKTS